MAEAIDAIGRSWKIKSSAMSECFLQLFEYILRLTHQAPTDCTTLPLAGFGRFQIFLLFYAGSAWLSDAMEMMILSMLGPAVCSLREKSSEQALLHLNSPAYFHWQEKQAAS